MNEKMPPGSSPAEQEVKKGEEEVNPRIMELRAWYQRNQAGGDDEGEDPQPEIAPEDRLAAGPRIVALEAMFVAFEAAYPVETLNAITDLTVKDAPMHPVRQPAKIALELMVLTLQRLSEETNVATEKYLELHAHYSRLQLAVGFINALTNKVRHHE